MDFDSRIWIKHHNFFFLALSMRNSRSGMKSMKYTARKALGRMDWIIYEHLARPANSPLVCTSWPIVGP